MYTGQGPACERIEEWQMFGLTEILEFTDFPDLVNLQKQPASWDGQLLFYHCLRMAQTTRSHRITGTPAMLVHIWTVVELRHHVPHLDLQDKAEMAAMINYWTQTIGTHRSYASKFGIIRLVHEQGFHKFRYKVFIEMNTSFPDT